LFESPSKNDGQEHFNYGSWTKGRFSEAVTVTGPGKMIFLAGIGADGQGEAAATGCNLA
jgi:hypothetical protein